MTTGTPTHIRSRDKQRVRRGAFPLTCVDATPGPAGPSRRELARALKKNEDLDA